MTIVPHILLVEDEPNYAEIVLRLLYGADYTVSWAPTGAAALELAATPGMICDLVLLDLILPDMKGVDFYRRLKATGVKVPPFLVVSGADPAVIDNALSEIPGATALIKPFQRAELLSAVAQILRPAKNEASKTGKRPATAS